MSLVENRPISKEFIKINRFVSKVKTPTEVSVFIVNVF